MLTWPLLCLHSWLIPELAAVQLQSGKESLPQTSTPTLVTRSWLVHVQPHTVTVSNCKYPINWVLSFPPSGYDSFFQRYYIC